MPNTQTKNNVIYVQFFDDTYLALTLLFHLILTRMSWLLLDIFIKNIIFILTLIYVN